MSNKNGKRKTKSVAAGTTEPGSSGSNPRAESGSPSARRGAASTPTSGPVALIAALRRMTGWRAWAVNAATALFVPLLLLGLTEGGLRLWGFGAPSGFCQVTNAGRTYIENYRYLWQFYSPKTNLRPNPFAVAASKPEDECRVVVFGESAAAGTPDPSYNFGRILDRMLRAQFPGRRITVINAAMRGVNSHILLPAARDACSRLKPDLVIVYMGNNEAVGLYAPGPRSGRLTPRLSLLRAVQWVRATRFGQLLGPLLAGLTQEGTPADQQDDRFFQDHRVAADDPRRAAVYRNFHANLADLCRTARRAGTDVILATVPVNLKDFPPLGSLHRNGLAEADLTRWQTAFEAGAEAEAAGRNAQALTNYQAASVLDDHFAELHFRLARCYFALGQTDPARREFGLACDWDALQFRTDSRLNEIVRQVAASFPDGRTRLADAERVFAQYDADERGIPGDRFFADHVHLNFDGDYLLAKTLFTPVCAALDARSRGLRQPFSLPPGQSAGPLPVLSREDCAAQLAFTRLDEGRLAAQMVQVTGFPPFTSQLDHARRQRLAEQAFQERFGHPLARESEIANATYQAAIHQFPDDWWLPYNLARLRFRAGDYPGAIAQFEAAAQRLPHWASIRSGLSAALAKSGRLDDALRVLTELRELYPEAPEIKAQLAVLERRGN